MRYGLALAALGLLGCSGGSSTGGGTATNTALLRRTRSCEDLAESLRADARSKVNRTFDAALLGSQSPVPMGAMRGDAGAAAPSQDSASGGAKAYTDTNVQVPGVDEADIVKTDGQKIYLLHGKDFFVLDAYPASRLAILQSAPVEGEPFEMYVTGSQAVIYSRVDGSPIYKAAGVSARPTYSDRYMSPALLADAMPMPGGWYGNPLTKVTVLTLLEQTVQVDREYYFEGDYLSSRRVGTKVRTVLVGGGHGPEISYTPSDWGSLSTEADWKAAMEKLRQENLAKIASSTLTDWLPYTFLKQSERVTLGETACGDFYVPPEGTTEYGLTRVMAFDLATADAPRGPSILGAVDTVYSNEGALYLAARGWLEPSVGFAMSAGGGAPVGTKLFAESVPEVILERTYLHKFDLVTDPSVPTYVASGLVSGSIKDSFSLDERAGVLRLATTESRVKTDGSGLAVTSSNVFTLAARDGTLVQLGALRGLGVGERIYSTRFLGDIGYVVTFRRTDPLFAIDLRDPSKPAVLGELQIPGFSEYMHPLADGFLLTIGQDADPVTGRTLGLAVQVFDVTDPAKPTQRHKFVFSGSEYGQSEASWDHKAFTYFPEKKLLAFPYVAYGSGGMRSSLEVFDIDVTAGISRRGSVDHTGLFVSNPTGYCGGFFSPEVRRGIFMDQYLYSISYGGVVANDISDLTTPLRVVPLPSPTVDGLSPCAGR